MEYGLIYKDLREFVTHLKQEQQLIVIEVGVDPNLEITEICDRVVRRQGPALLFNQVKHQSKMPVLANLFGTPKRVALAMGKQTPEELRELGKMLAFLKQPEPPQGFWAALQQLPLMKKLLAMSPASTNKAACQAIIHADAAVDLAQLPIQTCWPKDASPLITWGLVVTRGPYKNRQNLGVYRQQVIGPNRVIMRWLAHRGGALDYQNWRAAHPLEPFPVAVVLGADPATLLAAVTPIPDTLSEYAFAGLLRGHKTVLTKCLTHDLQVPANSEIILEGFIYPNDVAQEGPFGDHTGYYNEVETFPVLTITRITQRENAIYLTTHTGRPPDEPAMLGLALNELFVPLLQQQFPEICDFYLPPEGCSYRIAVVSIQKQYPGHAKRILFGIWSFLRQFMYTKWIIVVDQDINVRSWTDVMWAISTRMDPKRDTVLIENTPIDYLDFASPVAGLGSKMGFDATNKWVGETTRIWGEPISMAAEVKQRIDDLWQQLALDQIC